MNETLAKIKAQIVDPEIKKIKHNVKGYVAAVYYENRRCDIVYFDTDGAEKKAKRIALPQDGDGFFAQSLTPGDQVELSFRNRTHNSLFISRVYKQQNKKTDYYTNKGHDLPESTLLF